MIAPYSAHQVVIFPSNLGWMAAVTRSGVLRQLVFGQETPQAARRALDQLWRSCDASLEIMDGEASLLARRLQAYSFGARDDFRDLEVDQGPRTIFQQAILDACREVPYGETVTYGELACQAGYPRAARAVGNVMKSNRVPLIVPCHRVVASSGIGRYSAPGGMRTKLRLLETEALSRSSKPSKRVPTVRRKSKSSK